MAIDDCFVISDYLERKGRGRGRGRGRREMRSIDLVNGERGAYLRLKKMSTCALSHEHSSVCI